MTVKYTPAVEVYGANAALINSRLVDWEHVDAAGVESDQLKLTVNIEGLEGLPSFDAKIGLRVGYEETGLVDKGEFTVTRVTPQLFPAMMLIVATAAPFTAKDPTNFKARRSETYAMTALGQVFRRVVEKHGFTPRVAPELESVAVVHIDQQNETDAAFLTRLARRYDAVAKPVNDLYVLGRRGQLKTLSGKPMPKVTLSVTKDNRPGDHAFITANIDTDARIRIKGVKTAWWDGGSGKEVIVETGSEPFRKVRQRYQNADEARAAGEGELRKARRQEAKLRIDCPGDPAFGAEGLVELDATWPSFMRGTWSIDKVTASGSRQQSYRCTLEASYPDGRGA
ncbi:phage late control D family protein [Pseudomonas aeruginosa]|uniref:contractile injection system protein, VgrG/Pvc8 family n=1 Tax=Pseudomonas aeruginosa TaxID=287 RepID=UPI000E31D2B9|nr:contractile injection system protein, VgrG/Pvc8 family [Pseudomonas aeruginosa]NPZ19498.1 phage late control D family protein [Pseudomonas aeruginosa]